MAHYDDSLTLRDARRVYFDDNHFGPDGGYNDAWVRFPFGPIPVAFPNTAARVRAVRFHDLHHVMTGYATDHLGESEIGAWELGSGCADHYAAWLLNLAAMGVGFALGPVSIARAFVRGRHSRNLYRREFGDALLDRRVGEVRRELGVDRPAPRATLGDALAFAAYGAAAVAVLIPFGLATPVLGVGAALMARFAPGAAAG